MSETVAFTSQEHVAHKHLVDSTLKFCWLNWEH